MKQNCPSKKPSRLLSLAASSTLAAVTAFSALPSQAQSKSEVLFQRIEAKREGYRTSAKQILADLDPKISAKLDYSIFNGFEAGVRYTYAVEPAYQGDLHMRIDRWRPRVRLDLPDVFTRVEAGSEIVFIRNFPSRTDALKALPVFDIHKLPLSSTNALRLQPGEAVMMPVDLNLLFGGEASTPGSPVSIYGRGYYVMRGRYQIQVLRLDDERVRLRLVAIRKSGVEAEVGVKLKLDVFELSPLNNIAEGILGRRVGSMGFGRGPESVVMADYMFNLGDTDARNAYDRLLAADLRLNHVKMANPLTGTDDLQKMMISDLSKVDELAQADSKKPSEQRRIVQFFKGQSSGVVDRPFLGNFKVDLLRLLTFQRTTTVSQDNHIMFLDADNEESNFLAPQAVKENRLKLLFGLRNEVFSRRATVVVPTDSSGKPDRLGEYVVSVEVKDKRMGLSESADILKYFHRSVPNQIVQALALDTLLEEARYRNARVFVQIIFNEDALVKLQGSTYSFLESKLDEYLQKNQQYLPGDNEKKQLDWVKDHRDEAKRMLEAMAKSMNSNDLAADRIKTFINIQKNDFFREVGTGFIMSMLPAQELSKLVSVSVRADAQGFTKPVQKEFGSSDFRSVVRATEYIQHMLNQGTFDLRLETFGTAPVAAGQVFPLKAIKTPTDPVSPRLSP
ncbi:MAG: hypothetical protein EOP05_04905 [Proteobacteria bacterium]|nr:MAG: hypothetical protein EOP05_04905 [Pseudomonadota bacterium]